MEKLDEILKNSLIKQFKKTKYTRSLDCPSEITLSEYLDGNLKVEERKKLEFHLASCLFCQETLVLARSAINYQIRLKRRDIYKRIFRQRWLILASISFCLSFFFSRYFFQFLIATLIFGLKWILSPEVTKNLVMIFSSIGKPTSQKKEEEKIFEPRR